MKHRLTAIITTAVMAVSSFMLPCGSDISDWMYSITKAEAYESIEAYPDFSLDMYVADLMTDSARNDFSYEMLSAYVNEYESPNTIIFEPLRDNSTFQNSVSAWITVNAVFEPGESVAKTLDEEGYYEAIILNALNSAFQSENFYSGYIKKTYGVVDSTYSYFEDNSELVYYLENYKKLTSSEVVDFGEELKKSFDKNHPNLDILSDSMGYLQNLFMICDTAYEFIEKLVSYSMCSEMTEEMKALVHTLHNTCNGSENPAMKLALSNIATACDSYALAMGEAFADTSFKASVKTMTKIGDDFMKSCIAYFPAGKAVLLTQAITKSAVNFILSTDKIIEQYYKMERLYKFEMLMRSVLRSRMTGYQASPSEDNAKLLFAAVDVFFNTHDISCQYATDYAKILFEENIVGKYFGNTNQYNELTKSIRHIRSMAATEHEWIRYHYYLPALEQEYPDIYAAYCAQTETTAATVIGTLGVEFAKDSIEVGLEDDFAEVQASVLPADATNQQITYSSSNPEIADCSYGTVYPKAVGTAVITATTVSGGHTATLTVNVVEGHGADGSYIEPTLIGSAEVGDTFEVGGLTYKVTSETEVSVTDCDTELSGQLYIPENVGYYGGMFEVTGIGSSAFLGRDLVEVMIPDSVTSIGYRAFKNCLKLKNIKLPLYITEIESETFMNCESLEKIIFPEGLEIINGGYSDSSWHNGYWYSMGGAFENCTSLTEIVIPNSVLTVESSVFAGCTGLNKITLSNNLSKLGDDYNDDVFMNCGNIKTLVFSDGITEINSSMTDDLESSLEEVIIPETVINIGNSTFYNCTKLTSIDLPPNLERIGQSVFENCTGLISIEIPDKVTSIGIHAFENCTRLTSIVIPNFVTTIERYAFSGCTGLETVTIGSSVTDLASDAFEGCGNIKKLIFTNGIKTIDSGLTNNMQDSLEEVIIPDSVTDIDYVTFYGFKKLTSIELPSNLEIIENRTFYNCSSLKNIVIPVGVTLIEGGYSSGQHYGAFYGCSGLTNIVIPDSVITIEDYAFGECNNLQTVTIGSGITNFSSSVFANCGNIKKLIFSNGTQTINSNMTNNMRNSLEEVIIPSSVTTIGNSTFNNCTALTDVYFLGSEMEWNEIAIGTNNDALDTATIHFNYVPPKGDVNLDGTLSVADIVMMQRYLLANGSLTYWQAGDVCADEHLDAFDLGIMKRMLLS